MGVMTTQEAREYLNYLMTLCLRKEEAFAPLALRFVKEHDLDRLGLLPEEQVNLLLALGEAYGDEPKRYPHKLECLQKVAALMSQGKWVDPAVATQVRHEIAKLETDREIYNEACRVQRAFAGDKQRIIIETDMSDYFLDLAQKRAATYYQKKFKLSEEAERAQQFTQPSAHRKFEPDNPVVHKGFPGSCPPFKNARAGAFHVMLPFDLKISQKPDDPLSAGVRIWYMKHGYSFPLRAEWGKLCSWYDDQVLDLSPDDPNLVYISVSELKEKNLGQVERMVPPDAAPEVGLPLAFLYATAAVGTFIQIPCNIKIWFDASRVSLLLQGAPDLPDYGLHGASGLITRTYPMEKIGAYVESFSRPWQEGLSFNFINIHVQLIPGAETAFVPYNTPIFSVYPVLSRQGYEILDMRTVEEASVSGQASL
jgi:hypothetical protein